MWSCWNLLLLCQQVWTAQSLSSPTPTRMNTVYQCFRNFVRVPSVCFGHLHLQTVLVEKNHVDRWTNDKVQVFLETRWISPELVFTFLLVWVQPPQLRQKGLSYDTVIRSWCSAWGFSECAGVFWDLWGFKPPCGGWFEQETALAMQLYFQELKVLLVQKWLHTQHQVL